MAAEAAMPGLDWKISKILLDGLQREHYDETKSKKPNKPSRR